MVVYCRECGAEAAETTDCASCGVALVAMAKGAQKAAKNEPVFVKGSHVVPEVCCCCLNPSTVTTRHKVTAGNYSITFSAPWCGTCRTRKNVYWTLVGLCAVGVGAALHFGVNAARGLAEGDGWTWAAVVIGGIIGGAFLGMGIASAMPMFRQPGHAFGCDAFSAVVKGDSLHVHFSSRAFAERWRKLNGQT